MAWEGGKVKCRCVNGQDRKKKERVEGFLEWWVSREKEEKRHKCAMRKLDYHAKN